ncbi:testis-expressed protein 22 [Eptesicus fuscus]|uniref:testis-expressed protein 22 n=1 Tax=Eptesicus fuscus TaxID=29078 RepID=UPI002403D97B|nr:testis-expressed protein 22 [Eptesicus fuscus]XP_054571393.1 testis-expressed protein 22 [Eptesicus fuscus]XP_054571394.1 testis-expressed protein 22 [Eptesicus fuscus]
MSGGKHVLGGAPGKKPGPTLSQEHGLPAPLPSRPNVQAQPSAQSRNQQALETQDWVCEPPESRRPTRHWSLSIEERRQRALQDAMQSRPGSHSGQDILQIVARLVSEDVDRDVLIFHPPRSAESTHAFHAFLARSSPFWHNMTSAWTSGCPPS